MSDDEAGYVRRGYYAAVSFTDSLIGQLMSELDALGVANETIISLHGDHGWHLGEVSMCICICFCIYFHIGIKRAWLPNIMVRWLQSESVQSRRVPKEASIMWNKCKVYSQRVSD